MIHTGFLAADWPAPAHVRAGVTLRSGGVSLAPYDSLNLAHHVNDAPDAVALNRKTVRDSLALPAEPVWLEQVHGVAVANAALARDVPVADASFSTQPGVVCAVMTADCLPVLFCDDAGRCVAAAHAGWRGLHGGVLQQTIASLPASPASLMAWLGPAIGPAAFEVGPEVRAAFIDSTPGAASAFVAGQGDRYFADLYQLARFTLAAAGVTRVYGGGFCTFSDEARFYSYRRASVTGRMASLVWRDL